MISVKCSSDKLLCIGARARTSGFTNGVGQIWLDNVQCRGTENRLLDCPHLPLGVHNCNHNEDAGVTCLMADSPPGNKMEPSQAWSYLV